MTESKPEQTKPSTQPLPAIPRAEDMKTWNAEEVLQWIQKRDPNILEGKDVDNFKKARITGKALLTFDLEFFDRCGLLLAPLKDLADEVNQEGKTDGGKRKRDNTDASEQSISLKRIRQEDPLWESATRAREQRELIRKFITDLNSSSNQHSKPVDSKPIDSKPVDSKPVDPLPRAIDKLSDPTYEHKLAFPFIGTVPERFNEAAQNWSYVGRIMFRKLLEELKMVRKGHTYTALWLYGTQGYGKSHLLAILVCYLAAQDERVVYIPDCGEWLQDPVGYLKDAMLFAWADNTATQEEIETLTKMEEIEAFFKRHKNVKNILIVGDQLNALTGFNCSSEEARDRTDLYRSLMRFSSNHKAVFSSSANYREFLDKSKSQTSRWVVPVYGGLKRTEMDQWWKRHEINMGGYKKSDVEDVTGRIPLLLDKCIVGGKIDLTVNNLREIYDEAASFVQEIRDKTKNHSMKWEWYLEYVTACFRQRSLPSGKNPDLIDHRYFYGDNGIGRCVCGLARDAVAEQLLQWGDNFIDTNSLASLPGLIGNPVAVGFMIEHAILSSIRSNGLAINAGIMRPMKMRLLSEPIDIKADIRDEPGDGEEEDAAGDEHEHEDGECEGRKGQVIHVPPSDHTIPTRSLGFP